MPQTVRDDKSSLMSHPASVPTDTPLLTDTQPLYPVISSSAVSAADDDDDDDVDLCELSAEAAVSDPAVNTDTNDCDQLMCTSRGTVGSVRKETGVTF